jgi:hypothetical protein
MKKHLFGFILLSTFGGHALAQESYSSLGLPGKYATGLSMSGAGLDSGIHYDTSLKSSRTGVLADWFSFGGGFRFVGGVTANDTRFNINSQGAGTPSINGYSVNMAGHYFNMSLKYPTASTYLGVGYGRNALTKGLGFFADVGVSFGAFTADINTDLEGASSPGGAFTQAEIDAQKQKLNDSLGGLRYLPSVSLGLVYRY